MAAQVFIHLIVLFFFVIGTESWRCAKYENYFSQQPDYIDCIWDCCGNSFNRHCCAPIGIIVGCCIVAAVVIAFIIVLMICWWQRRRSQRSQGPKLFHNQRHSHYPVAPSSVTRPAPVSQPYRQDPVKEKMPIDDEPQVFAGPYEEYRSPPPGPANYGPRPNMPPGGFRPPPTRGTRPPPSDDEHDSMI